MTNNTLTIYLSYQVNTELEELQQLPIFCHFHGWLYSQRFLNPSKFGMWALLFNWHSLI